MIRPEQLIEQNLGSMSAQAIDLLLIRRSACGASTPDQLCTRSIVRCGELPTIHDYFSSKVSA